MDLQTLIATMLRDGRFRAIALNMLAQFGLPSRRYLGATLLPERLVPQNVYREDKINYRTIIANGGTRYSPTQKKGGELIGSFLVELAEADIAREFTSRDYDALLVILMNNASMEAQAQIINWSDRVLNLALIETLELWRWQAIINALVQVRGDNGYSLDVPYSNPAGHRVNVGGDWDDDTYDPYDDIGAMVNLLAGKGYSVNRIITSTTVITKLAGNAKMAARAGRLVVQSGGSNVQIVGSRPTLADINNALQADGLPPIERYDLRYRTQTGDQPFFQTDAMVLAATTGRDETLDLGDGATEVIGDTLGYAAVGRAAGQAAPGRVIRAEHKEDKPPRIEGEAWMTALPVITEPEAIGVLKNIV